MPVTDVGLVNLPKKLRAPVQGTPAFCLGRGLKFQALVPPTTTSNFYHHFDVDAQNRHFRKLSFNRVFPKKKIIIDYLVRNIARET